MSSLQKSHPMVNSPVTIYDLERAAEQHLTSNAFSYYVSGADGQQTLKENEKAFQRFRLLPRMLRGTPSIQMETTILGTPINFPVGIAPTAMHQMAHSEGEIATVKAAESHNICMILSTLSTLSMEQVAHASPHSLRWFQLYCYKDRNLTEGMVRRAERSGYQALVLTVDTPQLGRREADVRNNFSLPPHMKLGNFQGNEALSSQLHLVCNDGDKSLDSGLAVYIEKFFDRSLTWDCVQWLTSITSLPVVLKGILTPQDAQLAVHYGAKAIIVSNHGGRQLDGVPATIEVLPDIVRAVGNSCEVYLDGGIRRGTDVLKALALGARCVFVGRPVLWGLAYNGSEGVKLALQWLKQELRLAMELAGMNLGFRN
eukprot:Sdes_comp18676_c0_seq1m8928